MRKHLSIFAAALIGLLAFAPAAQAADSAISGNLRLSCGTATATAGAATLANKCGVLTSETLGISTAAVAPGSPYTLTLTNSVAAATDIVVWSVENGTASTGDLQPMRATPAAGSVVFVVRNGSFVATGAGTGTAVQKIDGTIKIRYLLVKP